MLAKYHIEYDVEFGRQVQRHHYQSDDPVAVEEFLVELLERQLPIAVLRHEGVEMSRAESDRMLKTAANMLAARHLCRSLKLSAEEERFRFGFTA